jgi:hypothetical protein
MVKQKGEKLHPAAEHYPELVEGDEEPKPKRKRRAG